MWVSPTSMAITGELGDVLISDNGGGRLMIFNDASLAYHYPSNIATFPSVASESNVVSLNEWQMVTYSIDNNDAVNIYHNGVLVITGDVSDHEFYLPDRFIIAEADIAGSTDKRYYDGALDDVGIYQRTLSAQEVSELYINQALVAHYPFNGNTNDESGNGHNGIVTGATLTNDRHNNVNAAYIFDSAGDQITATAPLGLGENISISAWVRLASTFGTSTGPIVEVNTSASSAFQFEVNPSKKLYLVKTDNSQTENLVLGTTTLTTDEWYYIAMVNNGPNVKFYVNGQLDSETTNTGSIRSDGIDMFVGGQGAEFFDGVIDEVRIYSKALTATDIADIYNLEKPLSTENEMIDFSFAEQTGTATINTGTISIDVANGTDVTSLVASFSASARTKVTVNGIEQVSGITSNDFTNIVIYTITAEDGITTQSWDVTVNVQSVNFALTSTPSSIDESVGTAITIDVQDNSQISAITFLYRGISEGSSAAFASKATTNTGTVYSATLTGNEDLLGVEFKFIAELTSGGSIESEVNYININHSGNGLTIPTDRIKFSETDETAYRVISVPLSMSNKNSTAVFDELGTYNEGWRLYSFSPSSSATGGDFQEQSTSGTSIQLGSGYFILGKTNATINTGAGETAEATPINPTVIQIKQGWNLIGNPYNFTIDWADVLAANSGVTNIDQLGVQLKVWLDSYTNSQNHLLSFQGGFVFSSEAMTIEIPVTKNKSLTGNGGRVEGGRQEGTEKDLPNWAANFNLKNNAGVETIMQLGMHENAALSYDKYDLVALPSLTTSAAMKIAHPEFFVPTFSSDFVPVAEYFEWEIELSNYEPGVNYNLNWDIVEHQTSDKIRMLYDVTNQKRMNMAEVNNYSFTASKNHAFMVYFGNEEQIANNLMPHTITLGDAFPNPVKNQVTIPVNIPKSDDGVMVQVIVYNLQGKLVKTITNKQFKAGFSQLNWNRIDDYGASVPSGIYIISMKTDKNYSNTKKIILE